MAAGDAALIKKINRSLILHEIVKHGSISRADLSKITNLTRATISAQVADLLEDQLVVEKEIPQNGVGRKPTMLSLNGEVGYALGIDLERDGITLVITDLLGNPITIDVVAHDCTDYEQTLKLLISHITSYQQRYNNRRYGIIGIVISIHGLVGSDQMIHFIPRLGWQQAPLKEDLQRALGVDVQVDNNANLTAFAERVFIHHATKNLISVSFYSGIGMGMIVNDQYYNGHDGFAGEIGHMIVVPAGKSCECGNEGCWEKYASEYALFSALSKLYPNESISYAFIKQRYELGDTQLISTIEQFIYYLSIGVNNVINIYNPDVVVLDSDLLRIYPNALNKIKDNLRSRISHYNGLYISTLGRTSCTLGACAKSIVRFLDIPSLNLPYEHLLLFPGSEYRPIELS
jgi:predicted NBD/HSP70 family sugar kinase